MPGYLAAARSNPLFEGIAPDDLEALLRCLSARPARYGQGDVILLAGAPIRFAGLIAAGRVSIMKEDADGRSLLLSELSAPEMFGEVFACAGIEVSPVTVLAAEACEILKLDCRKLFISCGSACAFHARLIGNMLRQIAQRNLMLHRKIDILSKRTIRERLLTYFAAQAGGGRRFTIPYNREEFARFLCVERSALSAELSKMRAEGFLRYRKNAFELLEKT